MALGKQAALLVPRMRGAAILGALLGEELLRRGVHGGVPMP